MPLYQPVPLLVDASMHSTASFVCNGLVAASILQGEESDDAIHIIHNYILILPISLQERLLHHILDVEDLDAGVRCLALKAILNPKIKSLTPGIFPSTYFKNISHVISCQGTCLETLDFRGIWLKGKLSCELQNVLCCLKNLKKLHIPHMATDSILEIIGKFNTMLQVLDIMGECNVTDAGVDLLCNGGQSIITHNLKCVLLGNAVGNEVPPRTVSLLIKYLPKLQSLGSYPNVGQAIEYLVKETGNITTNFIHIHDSYTDLNKIGLLISTMPMLQSIFVDHPSDGVLMKMIQFSYLIKVKFIRFQVNEFLKFIDEIGQRLMSIELMFGKGILDMSYVSKRCSNLVDFSAYDIECIRAIDQIQFHNVKNIDLFNSNISSYCFKCIIKAAPNMEKLSIMGKLDITDDDIIEIFTLQEFTKLKYIWFTSASHLTSTSVQILIECCPNLMTLGKLCGWNLTQVEANILKQTIQEENLALQVIEYFR